jgi:hypothetical protein
VSKLASFLQLPREQKLSATESSLVSRDDRNL